MSGVNPGDIWAALIANGASPTQAAGIMGNMMAESSLNPESAARDSNGQYSYGLIQWNAGTYPSASTLVTGNPVADLSNQIRFLASTGGFAAAAGGDPGTAASNFAHTYERCAACGYQNGSSQLSVRAANAQGVWQAAQTGNWASIFSAPNDSLPAAGTDPNQPTGPQYLGLVNPHRAIIEIPNPLNPFGGKITLLDAAQARQIKAFAFIGTGGVVMVIGIGVILAAFGRREIAQVLPVPLPGLKGSAGRTGANRGQRRPRPDADDRRAVASERDREATAARTGKTQDERARDARRGRTAPGPGRRRTQHPERRRQNLSTDPADRAPQETPF